MGKKKSFCRNTNIFCETDLSSYSSGTVIARGCGNKHQPSSSLTINILFFLYQLRHSLCSDSPLPLPEDRDWGHTALPCPVQPAEPLAAMQECCKLSPEFCHSPPASHFALAKEASDSTTHGGGDAGYSSYASNIPHSLDKCIALLACSRLYSHT